jgi:hypothetical protein
MIKGCVDSAAERRLMQAVPGGGFCLGFDGAH